MNPNPFKPTAGKRPPILIGRESVIEDFEEGLDNGAGAPGRLMLITGNRGCGKTVLLRELQRLASERGWAVVSDSASLGLCDRLAYALRSNKPVVTSMEFGPSFGRMSVEAARAKGETLRGLVNKRLKKLGPGKGILFAIDEAQSASIEELAALAVLYQQVLGDQDATGLPDSDQRGLALVFAGLPSMVDDLLEEPSVTFLRRAQQRTLGAISLPKVRDSYVRTVKDAGLYVDAETADLAARKSMGIPTWFSWWAITCGGLLSGVARRSLKSAMSRLGTRMPSPSSTKRLTRLCITGCAVRNASLSRLWLLMRVNRRAWRISLSAVIVPRAGRVNIAQA
ncbi:ATP-binding protein [Collinsella aerofaciens]|uniref:ATP-binding protein n=1 Tax=Collinsella aerofaciens TaxID=74426 RepID=UPI001E61FB7F|nr:ATP-binding protein [Collinsella aerofaciens]MDB1829917.1 ATP-binding protein [Collinsella aerofaciens]